MKCAIILMTILISGCGLFNRKPEIQYVTKIETVYVDKPVYTVPENLKNLPIVSRPVLKIDQLTASDKQNHEKVAKATAQTIIQLQSYCGKLELNEQLIRKELIESTK